MYFLLSFFWFIKSTKLVLFYVYLWQLKEYQVKRFLDHFRTEKGKRLILNKINLFKAGALIALLYFLSMQDFIARTGFLKVILWAVSAVYILEFFFFLKSLFQRSLKRPVFTKKTAFLILLCLIVEISALVVFLQRSGDVYIFASLLLLFDLLIPLISSLAVLLIQPIAVVLRNRIVKKAKIKRLQQKALTVVGITGSYGKTSTKEILGVIISEKFKVLKTSQHQNSEVGISQCLLNDLKPDHEVFVAEMGAYGRGGIKLLSDIVRPKIGILTGINEQHMALFGSQAVIIETKYELIESLPKDGTAIFNGDNKYCLELYKTTGIKKLLFSTEKLNPDTLMQSDIWAESIKIEKNYVSFKAVAKDGESADFKVKVIGRQGISNLLGAILAAKELGMTLQEITAASKKISEEQAALKIVEGKEGVQVLSATYSSNPDGVIANLDYLKMYPGKKVIIMPCLIELGQSSKEVHKRIGRKIGEICDLAIVTTKERFGDIQEGAFEAGMKKENVVFMEDVENIATRISIFCVEGDAVLLQGRLPKKLIELLED